MESSLTELSYSLSPFTRNSLAAALALSIYECFITHQDERRYIWKGPSNSYKYLYLFLRYFTLGTQLMSLYFMMVVFSRPVQPALCRIWYRFEAIKVQLVLLCVELILSQRVYALHDRSPRIGVFLLCVLCASNTVEMVCSMRSINTIYFDTGCMILGGLQQMSPYPAALLFTQTSIFILTIYKRNVVARDKWESVPILKLIIRDGLIVFGATSVITSIAVPSTVMEKPTHHLLPWFTVISSTAACRMIANTQRLHEQPQDPIRSFHWQTTKPDRIEELSTIVTVESSASSAQLVASTWPTGSFGMP
ncbi:hypothetical protein BDN72DRAFT_454193 [Pluteus cervinus]|uniref:Uncharacterized protein n=1 Tax=Pluteus cervinus TaxID=181527 RepID=A0ACD3BCH6_9AGAR|nr:hypothetical protein BDN72DRAFT_454193 [Pluteus cervinus]